MTSIREVILALPGIALTVLCWGMYGPVLHKGQGYLDNDRLKPLICVGAAYFIVAIIIPVLALSAMGKLGGGWRFSGISWSMAAGCAGAFGALGIILALTSGGKPIFVMPLVFGGAPIVNVLVSMYFSGVSMRDTGAKLPFFLAGVVMVGIGAAMVLIFAPKGHAGPAKPTAHVAKPAQTKPADLPVEKPATKVVTTEE